MRVYARLLFIRMAAGLKLGALFGAKPRTNDDLRGLSALWRRCARLLRPMLKS